MIKKYSILFIAFILSFLSCEEREWDNPYDPECPKELFTPKNFTAKQEGDSIVLSWTQDIRNISGFRIERKIESETFSTIASPGKNQNSFSNAAFSGGKLYTYKLYALAGDNKSNEVTTTITPVLNATISTTPPSSVTATTAKTGGNITSDGGGIISIRGVCYGTSPNPTIAGTKTNDGTDTGIFTSNLSGLTPNTTYYIRAYATNNKGTSYGNEITFKTYFGEVTDIDGNIYLTVKIGNQVWMAEDLKVTKYNDGSIIPNVTNNSAWASLTSGAYCSYNNDINYKNIYGLIYNWYAINTGRLAPEGWHVATDAEWTTLSNYLGGEVVAGGKLKESGTSRWQSPNGGATNETGFTSLPGGLRNDNGTFAGISTLGYWWCSTEYNAGISWNRWTNNSNSALSRTNGNKTYGFYIRCILGALSPPSVSSTAISNITATSATSGGNIANDGGSPVTARGVCWSTSQNPTTENSKTTDGTGIGSFSSSITGLTANTTYYVRAYAVNSQGTAYGNQVSFTTLQSTSQTVTDIEGNVYKTVTIGTQIWMAENLKTTKYNDGTTIPNVTDNTTWAGLTTGAYCWYNNDIGYKTTYGALYNWFAVNTGKLCPIGWHVPTKNEWSTLIYYFGDIYVAGGAMKETGTVHWIAPNTGATNSSGFSGLPGGERSWYDGTFRNIGSNGDWWNTIELDINQGWEGYLYSLGSNAGQSSAKKQKGLSVRCLKD